MDLSVLMVVYNERETVDRAVPIVRTLLRRHSDLTVVVAPAYLTEVRQRLGDGALARRVVTWR